MDVVTERSQTRPPYQAYACGIDQALGELVICSRCVGTWAAAGLATTQVLAPRFGRMLTWTLAGAAINDFLQAGFVALTGKANELERSRRQLARPGGGQSRARDVEELGP